MEITCMILSTLALLAVGICLAETSKEKKRSEKQRAVTVDYIDRECAAVERRTADALGALSISIAELRQSLGAVQQSIGEIEEKVRKLEEGTVPDYEQAKAAASAVNDFSQGISNILGFDPFFALQKSRENTGREAE